MKTLLLTLLLAVSMMAIMGVSKRPVVIQPCSTKIIEKFYYKGGIVHIEVFDHISIKLGNNKTWISSGITFKADSVTFEMYNPPPQIKITNKTTKQ